MAKRDQTVLSFSKTANLISFISILLFGVICFGMLYASWKANDHHLIYPLDDSYIHLSLAKQFGTTGIWGISPNNFQFCSSSPLFTLILSVSIFIFGNWEFHPLVINLIGGGFFLWFTRKLWISTSSIPIQSLFFLVLIFFIPLPLLAISGMEHLLQLGINCAFLLLFTSFLTNGKAIPFWQLLLCAMAVTTIRYEGALLIGICAVFLAIKNNVKQSSALLFSGAFPVVTLGLFSLSNGGTFLPTSVLRKSMLPIWEPISWASWIMEGMARFYENPFMISLGISLIITWILIYHRSKRFWRKDLLMLSITLFSLFAHTFLAQVGGYRYEAYLVGMTIMSLAMAYRKNKEIIQSFSFDTALKFGYILLFLLLLLPLALRTGYFAANYVRSTQNIYHQQFQMARFLQKNYPDASIAANDIGAITYFTDIQLTDLVGVGDAEVYRAIAKESYNRDYVHKMATQRNIELAVVHKNWGGNFVPDDWIEIGQWTIPNNFICGDSTVTFFAPDSLSAQSISQKLLQFNQHLPTDIHTTGKYTTQ